LNQKILTFAVQLKMMRKVLLFLLLFIPIVAFSQRQRPVLDRGVDMNTQQGTLNDSLNRSQFGEGSTSNITPKAPIDWYKIISIHRDTIAMDTTLTIK